MHEAFVKSPKLNSSVLGLSIGGRLPGNAGPNGFSCVLNNSSVTKKLLGPEQGVPSSVHIPFSILVASSLIGTAPQSRKRFSAFQSIF